MGRYDVPDPLCDHVQHSFRVSSHRDLVAASKLETGIASVWVCERPACIEDAKKWVRAVTGRTAIVMSKE